MTLRTIVAGTIILLASGSAHAQGARPDPRWQPWLGCWMPAASERAPISAAPAQPVCVIPADGKSAVGLVTIGDGRDYIDASGDRRTTDKDGCPTTDIAQWSADGRRVYIKSDSACADSVKRASTRLLAMSPRGEFLDVDGMTLGQTTGVRVLTYRSTSVPRSAPPEIAAALDKLSSVDTARLVASSAVTTADVAEASRAVGGAVVQAWLTALGQPFALDAKRLVQLADAGVPDNVIDVMVALSYPSAFAIKPSTTLVGSLGSLGSLGSVGSYGTFDDPMIFGDVWYGYFPYSYYPYGYFPYGYSPYRYSPYGYGAYGDYYPGGSSVIITRNPGAGDGDKPHGQVVNGRGYSSGSSSSGSSGSSSSGGSGSSSSGGSSGGHEGASSGGGRTAQPR